MPLRSTSVMQRKQPRYRVHLEVRYARASEFVREYAENISCGGLFIKGARGLQPFDEVSVDVTLPAVGSCRVEARVVHLITEEIARHHGREAGAGLQITRFPDGAEQELLRYLERLGRRSDVCVLLERSQLARLLAGAGFGVVELTAPAAVAEAVAAAPAPVIAVAVPSARAAAYREAAVAAGVPVVELGDDGDLERVLVELDRLL